MVESKHADVVRVRLKSGRIIERTISPSLKAKVLKYFDQGVSEEEYTRIKSKQQNLRLVEKDSS
ncbi:hypothetical protein KKH18_13990 [bacterium]|nr:hypothetical protein [bacterium]